MAHYGALGITDLGADFQMAVVAAERGHDPRSSACPTAFMERRAAWAGWPTLVRNDRGLHNRGAFATGLRDR
eukprot:3409869-Alexandrium_andersonii.AAC.1